MNYTATTTLRQIKAASPCSEGRGKRLSDLCKNKADDDPLHLLTVLDSNGLEDALWVLTYAMPDDRLARHFQAWCAEQVLHIFEAARPDDARVRNQIAMLRNDDASQNERDAARDAAWDAAAAVRDAAAGAAALPSLAASARDAWDAAAAARDAAAWDAALAAAEAAAPWDAAWDAARDAQERRLREMVDLDND